jgi:DNA-binding IclR family transcriptional regulator
MPRAKTAGRPSSEKAAPRPAHDKYFSRAISKALEAIEHLQSQSDPLPMGDIAERLRLSKTSTFRMVRTLETLGYVSTDGRGRYVISPGIQAITPARWVKKLIEHANPYLDALNLEFSETCSLAALFDNRVEVVAVVESPHVIRMGNVLGSILPPNASSLGKVITAFQLPAPRERLLRCFKIYRYTQHTITDPKELGKEYERIRVQGFAVDREENIDDGVCFSVPVFDSQGQVPAAISMSMPKTRIGDAEREKLIIEALKSASEHLTKDMNGA